MSAITGKLYPNDPSARPVSTAQHPVTQGTVPLRWENRPEWRSAPLGLFLRRSPPINHHLPLFAAISLVATCVLKQGVSNLNNVLDDHSRFFLIDQLQVPSALYSHSILLIIHFVNRCCRFPVLPRFPTLLTDNNN